MLAVLLPNMYANGIFLPKNLIYQLLSLTEFHTIYKSNQDVLRVFILEIIPKTDGYIVGMFNAF